MNIGKHMIDIKSIMIVDDSDSDQYINKDAIEEFDDSITIYQAYDGQEALEQLNEMAKQPDLILLDINMPRMNGFEFLEAYCKNNDATNVVAMLTSSGQSQDIEKAMQYGCVKQYLNKPLSASDLDALRNLD